MTVKRMFAALLTAALAACPAAGQVTREVMDADVDRAIGEVRRYLWAQHDPDGGFGERRYSHHLVPYGGHSVMAVFALLEAGESHNDERMKTSLEFLAKFKTDNLYLVAVRVMAFSQVAAKYRRWEDMPETYRAVLAGDIQYLDPRGPQKIGAWGYRGPDAKGDNSCSQFALLALWEADRAGVRIDPQLIRAVERTWLARQQADGGWAYPAIPGVKSESTLTMTTAGVASLFICQDVLTQTCTPYPHEKRTARAWEFLSGQIKPDFIDNGYLAFCLQRIGMAGGQKFIGGIDWFAVGATKLAEPDPRGKRYAGRWGPVVRAAFEMIFLSRGRIPLTVNKLQHGPESNWNFHTRDVPHFSEFMRRNFETRMRWQVIPVTDTVQHMLDAPILLIAGTAALDFTPEQWDKLREYTLRGGTMLLAPTHGGAAFLASAKEALPALYAEQRKVAGGYYTLEQLPANHPIYVEVHEKVPNGPVSCPMWGVSDGTRLLAVICQRDITCSWHRRAEINGRLDYTAGANFFLYTTGRNKLRMRMRPVFLQHDGEVRHRVKIARVKYGGNWNTQPYALDYLSQKLVAENRVAIDVTVGVPLGAGLLAGHHLAWMTGTSAFELTAAELADLKGYLRGGGTLFINAIGGAGAFNESALKMLDALFAGEDVRPVNLPFGSPLETGKCGDFRGPPLKDLPRTRSWELAAPKWAGAPLMLYEQGGRAVVIYGRHGIHDTLDGHAVFGANGYMPEPARDIAANIALYALAGRIEAAGAKKD